MESIIIFAIIAIISSAIQSAVKNGKQQKQAAPGYQADRTRPPQPVRPAVKPSTAAGSTNTRQSSKPAQKPKTEAKTAKKAADTYAEGVQTEGMRDSVPVQQSVEAEPVSGPGFLQDIGFEELQKSIIMAEVLGKPKALRKTVR